MVFTKSSEYENERAVILIKAAPQTSQKHGETVCCAGVTPYGEWRRLYPISFRFLEDERKFGRWDVVEYRWDRPKDDRRTESRRVDANSLKILHRMKKSERWDFLQKSVVTSLDKEISEGRSLALLKVEVIDFSFHRVPEDRYAKQMQRFSQLRSTGDLFLSDDDKITPYKPCPYEFKYHYRSDDGRRTGTCQDWEIEATFFKQSRKYGEKAALDYISSEFGDRYPREGMYLAMGTHSLYPETWLINGVIRLSANDQTTLF